MAVRSETWWVILAAGAVLAGSSAPARSGDGGAGPPTAARPRPMLADDTGPDPDPAILVAFRPEVARAAGTALLSALGLRADARIRSPYFVRAVPARPARAGMAHLAQLLQTLHRHPAVRVAEMDACLRPLGVFPDDSWFPVQYALHNTGQTVNGMAGVDDADMDVPEAWQRTRGDGRIIVGVLDSGIDYNHPDLAPILLRDDQGRLIGYDFPDDDPDPMDDSGHGTFVTGAIAAAVDNAQGIAGVADVRILPIRILKDGRLRHSWVIAGIDYARIQGARILNNSYGGYQQSRLVTEAVARAAADDILFVAGAGNNGLDFSAAEFFPAGLSRSMANVLSVGGTDNRDEPAAFTNTGGAGVDVAAAAVDVASTLQGGVYGYASGTSAASPLAAGVAALIRSAYPDETAEKVRYRLLGSADRPAGSAALSRAGRINAARALSDDGEKPGRPEPELVSTTATSLEVRWKAVGDDGKRGRAGFYDVRISRSKLTAANFLQADPAPTWMAGADPISAAGKPRLTSVIAGLLPDTRYWIGVRAVDEAGNVSKPSVIKARTAPPTTLFLDNAEGPGAFVGTGGWAITDEAAHDGLRSYGDSPGAAPAAYSTLEQVDPVALPAGEPFLTFWARTDFPSEGDPFFELDVSVAAEGQPWVKALLFLARDRDWTQYCLPLDAFAGRRVRVRFELFTAGSPLVGGAWLDEIRFGRGNGMQSTLLADDADGTPAFVAETPWSASAERAVSGASAYTESPGGPTPPGANVSLTQGAPVAIPASGRAVLTFAGWSELDLLDKVLVEASTDAGQSWTVLAVVTRRFPGWFLHRIPLNGYRGRSLLLRFRLVARPEEMSDGVWIDEIAIHHQR